MAFPRSNFEDEVILPGGWRAHFVPVSSPSLFDLALRQRPDARSPDRTILIAPKNSIALRPPQLALSS